ncbi:antibiotic biosynthesis monooxygenase [uncultured Roseobacter sp.]|uniref:putative quinol monooxygenase n=1 Tax=uncultured Roseobacter sp. TaxID=114847 RepID=UPI0026100264|nr:antibiotic biosynthesis monooxygenase [uncultured Roseobacter sp.]
MKLVTVEAVVASSDLADVISLFSEHAADVLNMKGCQRYALFCNPSGEGIAVLQQWESMAYFDDYRASSTFARLGQGLLPLMKAPPVTTVAEVDTV